MHVEQAAVVLSRLCLQPVMRPIRALLHKRHTMLSMSALLLMQDFQQLLDGVIKMHLEVDPSAEISRSKLLTKLKKKYQTIRGKLPADQRIEGGKLRLLRMLLCSMCLHCAHLTITA